MELQSLSAFPHQRGSTMRWVSPATDPSTFHRRQAALVQGVPHGHVPDVEWAPTPAGLLRREVSVGAPFRSGAIGGRPAPAQAPEERPAEAGADWLGAGPGGGGGCAEADAELAAPDAGEGGATFGDGEPLTTKDPPFRLVLGPLRGLAIHARAVVGVPVRGLGRGPPAA
eukprot:632847-Alexandrium_andersonii.AAC.2